MCELDPDRRPESHQSHTAGDPDDQPPVERPESRRTNRGWFQPGNSGLPGRPIRHGGRSKAVAALTRPDQAEARSALPERVQAILASLGGPEELTPIALGLIERHARLELVADYLFENLQRHGPLTGKGNTRAALTSWLQVVDRLQRSAVTLGLERKSKPVNPLDAVRQAVIEANR